MNFLLILVFAPIVYLFTALLFYSYYKFIAGRYATTNIYTLSEEYLVYTINIDSGKRWILNDIYGNMNKYWDGKNYIRSIEYDVLLRPVKTKVTFGAVTQTFEHIIYGTNAGKNTIGQIEQIKSQDGITSFEYDFKGNVSKETKQFTQNYIDTINWDDNIVMQQESFVTIRQYNAINKLIRERTPDNTVVYHAYDRGGLLNFVEKTSGSNTYNYISNIEYNARLQREKVYYGNNTLTHLSYDKNTFRLIRLLTTRNNGNDILQDINYAYDNEGNIIRQKDDAQQTHYFNNTVIAPTCNYEYDSLYRLIKATGRELGNLAMVMHEDFVNNIPCPNSAANTMQNYTQLYEYDGLGNILKMQSQGNWTRNYVYDTVTNRLLKHGTGANEYDYDAQGNITAMPHLQSMIWDYVDRLISASNGTFTSYYNYDNSGNRTRKVVIKDNIREERYYIGIYEVYRKYSNGSLDLERKTLNISEDEKVFVREETLNNTINIRYQYDNHLGSGCVELDESGAIITYEEYHPFGTTSYRSGRSEAEVSWKRYKYCGKERDEETGLYYYGARYYAAWLGRFVSVDPLQSEQVNKTPYNYCSNNPICKIDKEGKADDWFQSETTGAVIWQQSKADNIYARNACVNLAAVIWQQSKADNINIQGEIFKNIGSTFSTPILSADDSGGGFINYFQNQAISITETPKDALQTIVNNASLRNDFLSRKDILKQDKSTIFNVSIHKGQDNFIKGFFEVGSHSFGTVGSIATAAGAVVMVIPGAQLVSAGLIVTGRAMSSISTGIEMGLNVSNEEWGKLGVNAVSYLISSGLTKVIKDASSLTLGEKNVIEGFWNSVNTMTSKMTKTAINDKKEIKE